MYEWNFMSKSGKVMFMQLVSVWVRSQLHELLEERIYNIMPSVNNVMFQASIVMSQLILKQRRETCSPLYTRTNNSYLTGRKDTNNDYGSWMYINCQLWAKIAIWTGWFSHNSFCTPQFLWRISGSFLRRRETYCTYFRIFMHFIRYVYYVK